MRFNSLALASAASSEYTSCTRTSSGWLFGGVFDLLAPVAPTTGSEREAGRTRWNERELRRCGSRARVAVGGLGNRTLCDFYRERANFAIELCRRQWQSARALDGFSAWYFQRGCCRAALYVLQPSNCSVCFVARSRYFFQHNSVSNKRQQYFDQCFSNKTH